jgi:hypothetical protein
MLSSYSKNGLKSFVISQEENLHIFLLCLEEITEESLKAITRVDLNTTPRFSFYYECPECISPWKIVLKIYFLKMENIFPCFYHFSQDATIMVLVFHFITLFRKQFSFEKSQKTMKRKFAKFSFEIFLLWKYMKKSFDGN